MQKTLPSNLNIVRGQTQKNVNRTLLTYLFNRFPKDMKMSILDLPCGNLEFLKYVKTLFPHSELTAADIVTPGATPGINFHQMDLTQNFTLSTGQKFDVVSSISGVMMFSNTLSFIRNCTERIKTGGTFILTNDNNATVKDRLAYFFLGRYRIFNLVFEDQELMTENVPIHELIRLMRKNHIRIDDITYTSFDMKDALFLPFALVAYVSQWLYLKRLNTKIPEDLKWKMYPFKHLLCKHYIIIGTKLDLAVLSA
ncbi:class I SAM-dependent methyltransferase [uncultured Mucilaginibacter sp.]|uniref:class I SAM-dependent methyltransferase n=1 Tax=uncultured Mucilaginibacter sp. TaxID=797541 RepID=UPI00260F2A05|nr:class I SAM-dependent methyltransferase [uncultured Mucilaginibacter sp.]